MLGTLYRFVLRLGTWPAMVVLFLSYVVCDQLFGSRSAALGHEHQLLDLRFAYGGADVSALFTALGERGLSRYALSEVTLDLLFPFVYGAILLIFIVRVWPERLARPMLLAPLLGMAADLGENLTIALMAWTFDGSAPGAAPLASFLTSAKTILVASAAVLALAGALYAIWRARRMPEHGS